MDSQASKCHNVSNNPSDFGLYPSNNSNEFLVAMGYLTGATLKYAEEYHASGISNKSRIHSRVWGIPGCFGNAGDGMGSIKLWIAPQVHSGYL